MNNKNSNIHSNKDSNKSIKLNFRVDSSFYAMFLEKLQLSNLPQSEFIRSCILNSTVKQRCKNLENLIWNINKIGTNLNQISRYANEEKLLDEAILEEIHQININLANIVRRYSNDS